MSTVRSLAGPPPSSVIQLHPNATAPPSGPVAQAASGSAQTAVAAAPARLSPLQQVQQTLIAIAPYLNPRGYYYHLVRTPAVEATVQYVTLPFQVAGYIVQPWKWQYRRSPSSVARVRLRNNFLVLSGIVVLWYVGAWDWLWWLVRQVGGDGTSMVLKRLVLFTLIINVLESIYTLSYPAPLPPAIPNAVPLHKTASISPAHRRLIERSLQDLPPASPSPFSSPSKLSPSFGRSASQSLQRSSTAPLGASASRFGASSSASQSASPLTSSALRKDDPLSLDNPESPLRAFESRHSPKAGRALGAADIERMRREKW